MANGAEKPAYLYLQGGLVQDLTLNSEQQPSYGFKLLL